MREGWKYVSFEKSINKVKKQKSVKSKDYKEKGIYPIVSQESALISGYCDDESLLFRHSNPIVIFGDHTKNIKYIDFDFVVGADGVHILSPIEIIFPKFFYYQLCSVKLRNLGYARHYKLLKQSFIAIPPLYEQERIVSLLDLEFAKIDAIKANAEKQLQDAKDLFQSALKDLLTPKEGWENIKLVEEFDLKSGDYLPSKEQKDGCVPVYGGNGIAGYHDISNISGEQIIIGRVGALCGNIHYTIGDVWVTDNAFIVKNISTEWNRGYLKYVLEYLDLNQYATQSAQPVISNKSMKEVNLFKPSIDEQIIIFRKIELIQLRYLQLESNIKKTITLCNDLKQSILKDIFG